MKTAAITLFVLLLPGLLVVGLSKKVAPVVTVVLVSPLNGNIYPSGNPSTDNVTVAVTVTGLTKKFWKVVTTATGDKGESYTFDSPEFLASNNLNVPITVNCNLLKIDSYWFTFNVVQRNFDGHAETSDATTVHVVSSERITRKNHLFLHRLDWK
jgi:hypothetical protein